MLHERNKGDTDTITSFEMRPLLAPTESVADTNDFKCRLRLNLPFQLRI